MSTQLIDYLVFTIERLLLALSLSAVGILLWQAPRLITWRERRLGRPHRRVARFANRAKVIGAGLVVLGLFCFVDLSQEGILALILVLVAALGVLGRDVLASWLGSVVLAFDAPFQVGEWIRVGETYGKVESMGLRSVRLRTLSDHTVSIPNSHFLSHPVACANRGSREQMCVVDFFLPCDQSHDLAKTLVREAAASSPYLYPGQPIQVVLREGPVQDGADRFALQVTLKAYVLDGDFQVDFTTDITERARKAFREHGILTAGELEHREARRQLGLA